MSNLIDTIETIKTIYLAGIILKKVFYLAEYGSRECDHCYQKRRTKCASQDKQRETRE